MVLVPALLATAIAGGCGGSDHHETPEAVVERFEQAWNDPDGDPAAVCDLLTDDAIAALPATGRDDCASKVGRFLRTERSEPGTDPSIDVGAIVDTDETGGRATIKTDTDWTFTLEEQDGDWKLAMWPSAVPQR